METPEEHFEAEDNDESREKKLPNDGIIQNASCTQEQEHANGNAKQVARDVIEVAVGNEAYGARNDDKERPPALKKDINVGDAKGIERKNNTCRYQNNAPNNATKIEFYSYFFHVFSPFF